MGIPQKWILKKKKKNVKIKVFISTHIRLQTQQTVNVNMLKSIIYVCICQMRVGIIMCSFHYRRDLMFSDISNWLILTDQQNYLESITSVYRQKSNTVHP